MKSIWILPDRSQNGLALAMDESRIAPLNELIELSQLPQVLNLGIPEELVRAKKDELKFLFAQFVKLGSGKSAFTITAPAGTDLKGRIVFITNLQILEPNETLILPPQKPSNFPEDVKHWANQFDDLEAESFEAINQMLHATKHHPYLKSFASERLYKARFRPDWMPKKKLKSSLLLMIFLGLVLILISIISFSKIDK